MDFTHHTRAIAFADDLLVLTRGGSALEAEKNANQDLKKIKNRVRDNKMQFNEKNQEFYWLQGKQRKLMQH